MLFLVLLLLLLLLLVVVVLLLLLLVVVVVVVVVVKFSRASYERRREAATMIMVRHQLRPELVIGHKCVLVPFANFTWCLVRVQAAGWARDLTAGGETSCV